jgi:hypothetical protein
MSSGQHDKEQGEGFVVKDKRFSAQKEGEKDSKTKEEEKKEIPKEDRPKQENTLPEISFINLIFSLSTSALIQLGEIQDPATQQHSKNLPIAKQTIDLIALLKEKTKGNLTPEEEKFMENVLYDLKMRYVKAIS